MHFSKIAKSDYYVHRASLSLRMEQLRSHWTEFYEICLWIWI